MGASSATRLGLRSGLGDHAAAQHDGRQERFQHQAFAELLHDDHGLDRTAAVAAILFREGHAEPAQLGHLRPVLRQPALFGGGGDLAPVLEGVLVTNEALRGVLQLLLFVGKGQVHLSSPKSKFLSPARGARDDVRAPLPSLSP